MPTTLYNKQSRTKPCTTTLYTKKYGTQKHSVVFRTLCAITLASIYVLILVGASVRATGSGMGCPDWPKCFDMLIPPTHASQLPEDYQQIYAQRGYSDTTFNAKKTWIEFGNRMTSVVVGICMLLLAGYACIYLRHNRTILYLLAGLVGITTLQAWLGAIVVESHLHPFIVSSHMLLALLIIFCVHAIFLCATPPQKTTRTRHLPWLVACAGVLMVQIALGLQVRENVDVLTVVSANVPRYTWIAQLDGSFSTHMVWSLLALNLFAYTQFRIWRDTIFRQRVQPWLWLWAIGLLGNVATGSIMWLFSLPPVAQPFHLLFATMQCGGLWHVLLLELRGYSPLARHVHKQTK